MATVTELERLRKRALADPRQEGAYLRALLLATLYAHLPRSDDPGRMRLIMFTRPDGLTVVPVFTDRAKAQAAAGNAARVAAVTGRDLLEATRGATLMVDPNDISMTLYPEEIVELLDGGRAAIAPVPAEGPDLELQAPEPGDAWLMDVIAAGLEPVGQVPRFHLAAARPKGSDGRADRLLVIAVVPHELAERASRAIAVGLARAAREPRLPIDLATYPPEEALGAEMDAGLRAVWTREFTNAGQRRSG